MGFTYTDFAPGLRMVAHDTQAPTDAEWHGMVDSIRHMSTNSYRTLVISDGGGPNVQQLRKLDSLMTALNVPPKTAVVTPSTAMRAVVAAAGWVSKNQLKAYKPLEVQEAFRFLGITHSEASKVQHGIDAACRRLDLKLFEQLAKRAG